MWKSGKEQLVKYKDWIILKTSCYKGDKLIIGKLDSMQWKSFEMTPEYIESEMEWKKMKLNSSPKYFDSRTKIEGLSNNGDFVLDYVYRIEGNIIKKNGQKRIKYQIDNKYGKPEFIEVLQEEK